MQSNLRLFWYLCWTICGLGSPYLLLAQTPVIAATNLKKGEVVDTLRCEKAPDYSYAYYLPSNYDAHQKWPIVYIFEPMARGALPVDSFQVAAEQYGYIVVGSNNSRNGPWANMFEAANHLFEDTETRFAIDLKRVYTAGFSGGSRMATATAVITEKIAGVIACGAAFPSAVAYRPTEQTPPYACFGLVGDRDMNYQEMHKMEAQLQDWHFATRLRIFPAGHQWPSPDLLTEALEWMECQAMTSRKIPRDTALIDRQKTRLLQQIQTQKQNENWVALGRHYQYFLKEFPEDQTTGIAQAWKALSTSTVYQEAVDTWEQAKTHEMNQRGIYRKEIRRVARQKSMTDSIRWWWKGTLADLRKQEGNAPLWESQRAARTLNMISAQSIETAWVHLSKNEYNPAIQLLKLWKMVHPDRPWPDYQLARAQALNGQKKAAIKSLKRALEKGLDKKALIRDAAFDSLRSAKKFKKLLEE
ncbi:MAG: hypothetical protein AAGD05_05530 [Bacteroidota bacterium]